MDKFCAGILSGCTLTAGSYPTRFTVTYSLEATATQTLILTVSESLLITNATLPAGTITIGYKLALADGSGTGSVIRSDTGIRS